MEARRALKRLNDRKLTKVDTGDEVIPGLLVIDAPEFGCSTRNDEFGCLFRRGKCPDRADTESRSVLCLRRTPNNSSEEMWFVDKQEYLIWKLTK